jgi:hypothetical protein
MCVLCTTILCYIYFSGSIEPIEVFLNDPVAFQEFLYNEDTAKAIAASPITRRILTENGDVAKVLSSKEITIYYVIKNQALADKAIALLKSNSEEFTKFFQDGRVASKIVQTMSWAALQLSLSNVDAGKEVERLKIKIEAEKMIQGIR